MIDVTILRNDPDRLRAAVRRRGLELDVAMLVEIDERRRTVRADAERIRARQKESGKEISRLEGEAKQDAIAAAGRLADEYRAALAEADRLDAEFAAAWITVPNLPHESAADGATEDDNEEIGRWGEPAEFDFPPKDHVELGEALGILDIERAAKVSGTRFGYVKGELAFLEFALVRWAMDHLAGAGFTPVVPPVLVREHALFGTGFFPSDREQVYSIEADDLFLVGTSEVSLAAMHADEIFEEDDLPLRYAGFSTCFRREAGTYGKDTRGIFRVHQFDKVEMFSFTHPERSWEEHEYLFAREEALVRDLGLPHRVVNVCTGDLGASAAKKLDIEAWFPSQGTYREITSCSNTTDYQARRLKVRFRGDTGNRLVHTLNGTAVAIGRTLIAIMENFQRADGSIAIPPVLVPYTGFETIGPSSS
jgi:seryl-tRNA synthetase